MGELFRQKQQRAAERQEKERFAQISRQKENISLNRIHAKLDAIILAEDQRKEEENARWKIENGWLIQKASDNLAESILDERWRIEEQKQKDQYFIPPDHDFERERYLKKLKDERRRHEGNKAMRAFEKTQEFRDSYTAAFEKNTPPPAVDVWKKLHEHLDYLKAEKEHEEALRMKRIREKQRARRERQEELEEQAILEDSHLAKPETIEGRLRKKERILQMTERLAAMIKTTPLPSSPPESETSWFGWSSPESETSWFVWLLGY